MLNLIKCVFMISEDGTAVTDDKCTVVIHLTEQEAMSDSTSLFTNRATYILLATESKTHIL